LVSVVSFTGAGCLTHAITDLAPLAVSLSESPWGSLVIDTSAWGKKMMRNQIATINVPVE